MKKCEKRVFYFKNYNLNVTEVLDSTLKKIFPGIFNFTVGILIETYTKVFELSLIFDFGFKKAKLEYIPTWDSQIN